MQESHELPGVISVHWVAGSSGKNDKGDRFNMKASLRVKRRCQLIVRLKTIEYKENISCYLSFYINLLNWL